MQVEVSFRRIEGTAAALGWAGTKTVIADRRDGSAGGRGLGLSGGVRLEISGEPLLVTSAEIRVKAQVASGEADAARLLAHAEAESTISNSVARGFPVSLTVG
jgi:hypothetical protein